MKLKFLLIGILFMFAGFTVNAQGQYTVKSKVLDEQREPLPGVSILEVGTQNGTITDVDGNFVFKVASEKSVVRISFLGYKSIELSVSKLTSKVILSEEASDLQEVVVVGYETLRKKDVTGAVASVTNDNLNKGATTNPLQQIAGKAAGVVITQTGSEPGTSPSIRIRGITSLIGGSDPLVVIDGVQGNVDLLNQLPPNEIESVDILKDASATAIYGSRGAAGVILVTTKKSESGSSQIEVNSTVSMDMISKKLDLLSADQWRAQSAIWGVPVSADHGSNTDWYGLLTKTGYTQNHSIAIGGGTKEFNYRASLSAILQDGVVINSSNQNYIGRFQATQKALNDKLILSANLSASTRQNTGSPSSLGRADFTSNLISNAYVSKPTDPVLNSNGTYFSDPNVFQYINPYAVAQTVVNNQTVNNFFGNLKADLELTKGLTVGWFGSWRKLDGNSGYYLPSVSTVQYAIDNNGVANINNWHEDEKLTDINVNFKRTFGNHSIDAIAVYEWQRQTYNGNFTQMKGFINDNTTYNALQNGNFTTIVPGDISSYKNDRTLVSFLGRVNYSYMNRYLLTLSMRRDGSSVFGVDHKWGNFPSASVAWRMSEESFMKGIEFLNDLKLRVGYGVTGNQQGLYPQQSQQLAAASGQTYFGGNQITNYAISQNGNADLKWETRAQTNIGVDFALLKSRISGSIDVYSATTSNLLFNYTVPQPPYPYGSIVANVGSLLNEGVDVNLNFKVIQTKDFNFSLNGNLSLLRNKVLTLSGSINGVPLNTNYVPWGTNSYLIVGQPVGVFNILQHLGKDASNSETVVGENLTTGTIDAGDRSPNRKIEGSALPTYTYAFSPVLSYKNFDLSMLFRGSGGNKIYNTVRQKFSYFESLGKQNMLASAIPLGLFTSQYASDLWLEDGSFLRFDNLTVGYRFDTKQLKYVSNLHLSLTATNLALFTKYTGLDPEMNVSGANAIGATGGTGFGTDNGIYPRTTTIAVGLNVTLK
ncbi:MAG: TonB-dependent receptor [Paludibacter sp.]|nr:TonB-dependent receptor [Paludibacter sp.]